MMDQTWRTSSFSGNQGNCVEARFDGEMVHLRDTKDRSKPEHVFTIAEWKAFVAGVKAGEFEV